ncbi:cytochrome P450 [Schizothecium vesticola]|uniref:Cytochrome P450 n=1 Tax=Schizothecium vesticola TaxID=314040 RepID=A0AA40EI30_9PEZI|nr:cytochrome P450 [Schizothecium vesticola]
MPRVALITQGTICNISTLWRFFLVRTGNYHRHIKDLHDKYGPVSTDEAWRKTEFYHNNSIVVSRKIVYNIFSMTDPAGHARMQKPIANWSIALLAERPNGYMTKGSDFDSTIANLDKTINYFSAVGQMPFLDFLFEKNPIMRIGPPNLNSHFIGAKAAYPDVVDDNAIMGYIMIPLLASANTTTITIHAVFYFLLRNPATYRKLKGADENESAYQNRLRAMKAVELAFGAGARICTGWHLALVEVYKMTATLVSRFDIELVDPAREWTVAGIWFARQTGILCHLQRRGR